jgi:hypothetical protein
MFTAAPRALLAAVLPLHAKRMPRIEEIHILLVLVRIPLKCSLFIQKSSKVIIATALRGVTR